jgi:thiamine biosynthesis lipoprotein
MRLDLGGIAKGYAVDRATAELLAAGMDNTLVNAGGDLRIAGHWSREVLLRDPRPPHQGSQQLTLHNAALATSAAYYSRRRLPRGEVSALVNPRCGTPYIEDGTASVQAADCMSADALTKVVLFAPPRVAECALAACSALAFIQSRTEAAD